MSLATNQIRLELLHPLYPDQVTGLEFENLAGALVAGIAAPGWLEKLPPGQRFLLHNALATLYKLAGIDLVREQPPHRRVLPCTSLSCWNCRSGAFQQIPITSETVRCLLGRAIQGFHLQVAYWEKELSYSQTHLPHGRRSALGPVPPKVLDGATGFVSGL